MQSAIPVLQPESPQAQAIYDLLLLVLWISAAIFTIVSGLVVVAVVKGRSRSALPVQEFGSHKNEIAWMVGPVIIVLWIAAISGKLVLTMNAVPKSHPPRDQVADAEITVTGHQWWWEVQYSQSPAITANEIYIPVGKKIRVKLSSADVIHCFWVPQLARKIDAIPGRDNYVWLEANRPGTFQGRCAEFCGTQHAWMNFTVIALDSMDYSNWLSGSAAAIAQPTGTEATAGQQVFFSRTCASCHAIDGTNATASIGPNLTRISDRGTLGGGVLENSRQNLVRWLKNPQAFKPGCKMPNFKLTDDEVRQLVAYLESLN